MKRLWLWVLPGVFLLAVAGIAAWTGLTSHASVHAAERFLTALCAGDLPKARELSAGRVAWDLSRQPSLPEAEVVDLDVSVVARSDKWAKVRARLEVVLADGTHDVGWYDMNLVRNEQGWVVTHMDDTGLPVFGWGFGKSVEADLRAVMETYLRTLAQGDYDGAGRFLAGPARRAHERAAPMLGQGRVISAFEEVDGEVLWSDGKRAVARFSYKADGRDVAVQVFAYRTGEGWKLVQIHPGSGS
jgi:hypothetical protein